TPQGGVLSPLLANVVLNEFDWWIVSQWEGQTERLRKPPKKQYNQKGTRVMSNEYKALRSTRLKEMYIVRYADDAKIFCRNREDAERTYEAVCGWLQARLKLNVSPEKSKVTNLRKQYCEFLGFKMKVVPRGKESDGTPRYVVRSHVCDKALERIKETLRDRLDQIQRPRDSRDLHLRVNVYNAIVIGIQNYYSMATMVSDDLNGINRIMQGRINRRIATDRKGHWSNDYLKKRYGKSRMMRWVSGTPILPIGYVRHMHPMPKPKEVNAYTPEGRRAIHKNLGMDTSVMLNMMRNPIRERTIEYNDNRISLYVAQQGRCAVTGIGLEMGEIHCHHKKPTAMGGSDRYQNLVILHKDVHVLVHANADETIVRYAGELNLTERQLGKVNKLRAEAGLKPIENGMSVSSE
ncbi:MAG: group II intron reverse transcriptase/maturase, partial [Eggerthellaceae bacterium]|nr:group II intron reverse transcriptase/maturase [Eggerthellaceae bacterium]